MGMRGSGSSGIGHRTVGRFRRTRYPSLRPDPSGQGCVRAGGGCRSRICPHIAWATLSPCHPASRATATWSRRSSPGDGERQTDTPAPRDRDGRAGHRPARDAAQVPALDCRQLRPRREPGRTRRTLRRSMHQTPGEHPTGHSLSSSRKGGPSGGMSFLSIVRISTVIPTTAPLARRHFVSAAEGRERDGGAAETLGRVIRHGGARCAPRPFGGSG